MVCMHNCYTFVSKKQYKQMTEMLCKWIGLQPIGHVTVSQEKKPVRFGVSELLVIGFTRDRYCGKEEMAKNWEKKKKRNNLSIIIIKLFQSHFISHCNATKLNIAGKSLKLSRDRADSIGIFVHVTNYCYQNVMSN